MLYLTRKHYLAESTQVLVSQQPWPRPLGDMTYVHRKTNKMKYRHYLGSISLAITIFVIYHRLDIMEELFSGRPLIQLEIAELLLPIILLIVTTFLFFSRTKHNKDERN